MGSCDEYIGFYEWDELPCQIKYLDEDQNGLEALAYITGEGFSHVSVSEVLLNGLPIGEKTYRRMVMELAVRHLQNR
jgi:hypothetical protein